MSKACHSLLRICMFGHQRVEYAEAQALQQRLAAAIKASQAPDTVLLLQHPPVYTVGKRGTPDDFLVDPKTLGVPVHTIPRGGETTFHGPGQVVMYPIVNLRRLGVGPRVYVEGLEDIAIRVAGTYGLHAKGRLPGQTGIWVGDRKLTAIGVQISHGITTHGLAMNVNTDLAYFKHIVPCGIQDKEVTSLQRETGVVVDELRVADQLGQHFAAMFRYTDVHDIDCQEAALQDVVDQTL